MKPILKLLTLLLLLSFSNLSAQTEPCGSDAIMQEMIEQTPNYPELKKAFNQSIKDYIGGTQIVTEEYEIPTVVHIMHNNGPENISNDQVFNAIQKANDNLAGMEGGFDTSIKLVLANIDPDGNCTNGIVRVQTDNPDGHYVDQAADQALKDQSRWPVNKYLNIWVVRCIQPDNPDCLLDFGATGYSLVPPL